MGTTAEDRPIGRAQDGHLGSDWQCLPGSPPSPHVYRIVDSQSHRISPPSTVPTRESYLQGWACALAVGRSAVEGRTSGGGTGLADVSSPHVYRTVDSQPRRVFPPSTAPTRENWCIELASYHRLLSLERGLNNSVRRWTGKGSPVFARGWQTTGRTYETLQRKTVSAMCWR
jgi:hypothetical protein